MLESLQNWTNWAWSGGVRLVGVVLVALVLIQILRHQTRKLFAPSETALRSARMRDLQRQKLGDLLFRVGFCLIVAIAVLTMLPLLGISVLPAALGLALALLVLALGAQPLIRDIVAGFYILLEDQFVVGDTIRTGLALGRVEEVSLRRTLLRGSDGALVTIPNNEVRVVENLSRDWAQVNVDVGLEVQEKLEPGMDALDAVATGLRNDPVWSAMLVDGPRLLGVESLAPNGTTLRLQMRCVPGRQQEVARELRRRIKLRFELEGLPLASGQAEWSVTGAAARS